MNRLALAVVLLVALERLVELWHSNRNARALIAQGGVELGQRHYPLMVALHAAWLAAIPLSVPAEAAVSWPLLAVFAALQPLRLWIIATLGRYWTTRIINVPGAPVVRSGPYRFIRHPNYATVAAEIAILPLAFGAWQIAVVFSLLNGALLAWRIGVEDHALATRRKGVLTNH